MTLSSFLLASLDLYMLLDFGFATLACMNLEVKMTREWSVHVNVYILKRHVILDMHICI